MPDIDLNCDLGEGTDERAARHDAKLLRIVTSANIACGGHAGDHATMAAAVRQAVANRVAIGAHPGHADRARFGRMSVPMPAEAIERLVAEQVAALDSTARSLGAAVTHVKPHGALYHDAMTDPAIAGAIARGVARINPSLALVGLAGSAGAAGVSTWRSLGCRVLTEAFADRRYDPGGALRPRASPGSLIDDPEQAAAQAVAIATRGTVSAGASGEADVRADTLCVHSDTPGALVIASAVAAALRGAGVEIRSPLAAPGADDELGVCSWSLEPAHPEALAERVLACGLRAVQLDLRPVTTDGAPSEWSVARVERAFRHAGIRIVSGMFGFPTEDYSTPQSIRRTGGVRPDAAWESNLALLRRAASVAGALRISLVTMHAGFIPHDRASLARATTIERLRDAAAAFNAVGASLALETGQEDAASLASALDDLAEHDVGVNFDPANIILYGAGDPVSAFRVLAPRVRQMHLKDAMPPPSPGEWGADVPIGAGRVDFAALLGARRALAPRAPLLIEREAGDMRVDDVRSGAEFLRSLVSATRSSA